MPYYPDKAGHLILLDMVNDLRSANYQPGQLVFGQPESTVAHGRNTVVAVNPPQGQGFLLHYNRLWLEQLFGVRNLQIPDNGYQSIFALLGVLNGVYQDTMFTASDFVDTPISQSSYPKTVTLIASNNSYLVAGSCTIQLTGQNSLLQILTEDGLPILTQEDTPIILEE